MAETKPEEVSYSQVYGYWYNTTRPTCIVHHTWPCRDINGASRCDCAGLGRLQCSMDGWREVGVCGTDNVCVRACTRALAYFKSCDALGASFDAGMRSCCLSLSV